MREKIKSLDCLRAIACLYVLLGHMHLLAFAAFGVSLFFVLSGFLMAYNYIDRPIMQKPDAAFALRFGIKKVTRFYPLYLIMLVFPLCLQFWAVASGLQDVNADFILRCFSTVFLLQSLVPSESYYYFLNSPAWYLSAIMFVSMLFPFVLRSVRKCGSIRRAVLMIALSFAAQFISCGIVGYTCSRPVMLWFSYICPLTRFFDVAAGAYVAYIYINIDKSKLTSRSGSLIETGAILLCLAVQYFFILDIPPAHWSRCSIYFIPSVCAVLVCALGKGIFTRLLTNPVTKLISDLSAYLFLIHAGVISAVSIVLDRLPLSASTEKLVYIVSIPIISFALSYAYHIIEKKRRSRLA